MFISCFELYPKIINFFLDGYHKVIMSANPMTYEEDAYTSIDLYLALFMEAICFDRGDKHRCDRTNEASLMI